MKKKTKSIDIRDFLHSDNEIANYIDEVYNDEDHRMFLTALGNAMRSKGVSKDARETGFGRENLYKIFLSTHHLSGTH